MIDIDKKKYNELINDFAYLNVLIDRTENKMSMFYQDYCAFFYRASSYKAKCDILDSAYENAKKQKVSNMNFLRWIKEQRKLYYRKFKISEEKCLTSYLEYLSQKEELRKARDLKEKIDKRLDHIEMGKNVVRFSRKKNEAK